MCRFLFLQLHVTKVSVVPVWEGLLLLGVRVLGFLLLRMGLCILLYAYITRVGCDAGVHEVRYEY